MEFGEEITEADIHKCADSVLAQSDYLSKIIDDFSNFFISTSDKIEIISMDDVMERVMAFTINRLESNNIIVIQDIEICELRVNKSTFIQSILNIIYNSIDAITHNKIKNRYIFITCRNINDNIVLTIKDSGGGISEVAMNKLFEPYYTTKFESIGTGIGLYLTHQIIVSYLNGYIDVNNSEYTYKNKELVGAEFVITIPLS